MAVAPAAGPAAGLPSPMRSSLTAAPSPRVDRPRALHGVPATDQSDPWRTVESPGTSTHSLTRPSSDRAADCPDFARAACICPLRRSGCRSPIPAGRGPSLGARQEPIGTPDRVLMCAPASLLATPAPPLSIPGPGLRNGFLPGPIVVNGPDSPAMGLPSRRGAGFKGPSESGTGLGPGRPWLPECWPGSLNGPVAARSRSGVAFWVAYPGGLGAG